MATRAVSAGEDCHREGDRGRQHERGIDMPAGSSRCAQSPGRWDLPCRSHSCVRGGS